ncbi:hypothetical protein A6E05_02810 [Aliivibrio sp. 1S165]|uniref:hypothetical protein n=1 Tax=unclassified Aliivibrio TaxID=2645654 RepID=UPI00080E08B6|nr:MULTISPECIES: hypothetical protein [unclassified Aliivibrio]OCH16777.1 hypothetical protein A6E05_02810 [Aliivibrio sp. 1S165]OCH32771.1 hypothetical protein A6E06_01655 [Aliivibrio sp. 1S175]
MTVGLTGSMERLLSIALEQSEIKSQLASMQKKIVEAIDVGDFEEGNLLLLSYDELLRNYDRCGQLLQKNKINL